MKYEALYLPMSEHQFRHIHPIQLHFRKSGPREPCDCGQNVQGAGQLMGHTWGKHTHSNIDLTICTMWLKYSGLYSC